jgi:hypothetical protein
MRIMPNPNWYTLEMLSKSDHRLRKSQKSETYLQNTAHTSAVLFLCINRFPLSGHSTMPSEFIIQQIND